MVLDWYPQYAAQHIHTDARTRFIEKLSPAERKQYHGRDLCSIASRGRHSQCRAVRGQAPPARVRGPSYSGASAGRNRTPHKSAEHHSAAISCCGGSNTAGCAYADLAPQQTYQDPNTNSSIAKLSARVERCSQGLMKGLPSMVRFINQSPNGNVSWPIHPGGTLPSMTTMRPPGRKSFQAWRSTVAW